MATEVSPNPCMWSPIHVIENVHMTLALISRVFAIVIRFEIDRISSICCARRWYWICTKIIHILTCKNVKGVSRYIVYYSEAGHGNISSLLIILYNSQHRIIHLLLARYFCLQGFFGYFFFFFLRLSWEMPSYKEEPDDWTVTFWSRNKSFHFILFWLQIRISCSTEYSHLKSWGFTFLNIFQFYLSLRTFPHSARKWNGLYNSLIDSDVLRHVYFLANVSNKLHNWFSLVWYMMLQKSNETEFFFKNKLSPFLIPTSNSKFTRIGCSDRSSSLPASWLSENILYRNIWTRSETSSRNAILIFFPYVLMRFSFNSVRNLIVHRCLVFLFSIFASRHKNMLLHKLL